MKLSGLSGLTLRQMMTNRVRFLLTIPNEVQTVHVPSSPHLPHPSHFIGRHISFDIQTSPNPIRNQGPYDYGAAIEKFSGLGD